MDNKIAPVETFIKQGLQVAFRRVFDTELTITNVSGKREILQKRAQGRALKYPLAFAELSTLALNPTNYRSTPLLRRGMVGQTTSDNLGTFKVPLISMSSTYQILYVTNNFAQAELFGKLWLMAAAGGFLKFSVEYGVVVLDITTELDRQVNFPQRDSSPDAVEEYEVTTSLVVEGYGSHDKLILEQAAKTVEVSAVITQETNKALMQEDSPGNVQVFTFTKDWPAGKGPLTS